jgi:glycosyltransferase involved in cell wall biosynthesis
VQQESRHLEKVLLLAPRLEPRGTSEYTLHLAKELRQCGVDAAVFCVPGQMLAVMEKAGVPVTTFRHLESLNFRPGERRRLTRAVRGFAPQLIHGQSARVADALRLLARVTNVPQVLTVHWRPPQAGRFRRLSRRVQGIIATTQDTREEIVNRCRVDRGKITVINNGVDVAHLDERAIPPIFQSPVPAVGSLGPVEEQRGHELFVQAASVLVRGGVAAQFVVAGVGGELPGLRRLVKSLGLEHYVTLATEFGAYEDVLEALDVIVQSSLVDVSGFSILSSMACGRPVVAFNTGTACEIIEEGKSGLLVPKGDAGALADAVSRLLSDRELARRIGEDARRRVKEKFDIRNIARRTLQYYSSLLGEGPA